eukprot:7507594-Pyramimonas_sp.AAC.1
MSPKAPLGSNCGTARCAAGRGRTRTRRCCPRCISSTWRSSSSNWGPTGCPLGCGATTSRSPPSYAPAWHVEALS